jgi:hypothetical protein
MKMSTQHWWNDTDGGKPMYSEKTCPTATLSTTNFTWTNLKSNLGLRGEKSVTNPLENKSAFYKYIYYISHVSKTQYASTIKTSP